MRTEKFKNLYFPFCISKWKKSINLLTQSENTRKFKNTLMKDIKSNDRLLFSIHDLQLYQLRLNVSHLNEHKFRHNFKECVSSMSGCGLKIESVQHFFLRCHFYHA